MILVRTNHPCLRVGCHINTSSLNSSLNGAKLVALEMEVL
jgi:hypothetical protein